MSAGRLRKSVLDKVSDALRSALLPVCRRLIRRDAFFLQAIGHHADNVWSEGRRAEGFAEYGRWVERRRELAGKYSLDSALPRILDSFFTNRIGHMALLDLHVKQRILSGEDREAVLLVTHGEGIANRCYLDYWAEHLPIVVLGGRAYRDLRPVLEIARTGVPLQEWPRGDGSRTFYEVAGIEIEGQWQQEGRPPLLRLTDSHMARGRACLATLGVPENAWFVTLHVREARDQPTRNADPSSYIRAVEAVVDRGGYVVRLGSSSMTPLGDGDRRLVDYAHSGLQSDWMDIFLLGGCRFLIGCQSGPHVVPGTFGIPVIHTNWHPVTDRIWFDRDLIVPKRYLVCGEGRLLTWAEAVASPAASALEWAALEAAGVELLDNSPEDIAAAVVEMLDRLDGIETCTGDDATLQRRYASVWRSGNVSLAAGGARVSRDFLREHADLLPT